MPLRRHGTALDNLPLSLSLFTARLALSVCPLLLPLCALALLLDRGPQITDYPKKFALYVSYFDRFCLLLHYIVCVLT